MSPNAQVPVVITNEGTALFESEAIVEFINEEYGPLQSRISNEQKAIERAWSYQGTKLYLAQCRTMSAKDRESFEQRGKPLMTALSKVEEQLSGDTKYFSSDQISNVDIAWMPLLYRADLVAQHTKHDFLQQFPKVKKWKDSLVKTSIAEKSVSSDFFQKFKDFYLTNTYISGYEAQQSAHCCAESC